MRSAGEHAAVAAVVGVVVAGHGHALPELDEAGRRAARRLRPPVRPAVRAPAYDDAVQEANRRAAPGRAATCGPRIRPAAFRATAVHLAPRMHRFGAMRRIRGDACPMLLRPDANSA